MIRYLLYGIFIILGLGLLPQSSAQEPLPPPEYSILFTTVSGETFISSFYADGVWRYQSIPARLLYGDADVQLALPKWSADGAQLFSTIYEPGSEQVAGQVIQYDLQAQSLRPITQLLDPQNTNFEFMVIESASPDGNYVWVRRIINPENILLNTQTGQIIPHQLECPARVLTWTPDDVLLTCTGEFFAEPTIMGIRLATGEQNRLLFPPPPLRDNQNPFASHVTDLMVLDSGRYLVGSFDTTQETAVGIIEPRDYRGTYYGVGSNVRINNDQTYLAFYSQGRIKRVNLETNRVVDLGAATPVDNILWHDDKLIFWTVQETSDSMRIIRTEVTPITRTEHVVYDSFKPLDYEIAPRDGAYALMFQPNFNESYVEIYRDDRLIWVSDFVLTDTFVSLLDPNRRDISWDGDWVFLNYIPNVEAPPSTLAVNTRNGEVVFPPEANAIYVGASPDSQWWVYEIKPNPDQLNATRLIAFNVETNAISVLNSELPMIYKPFFAEWRLYSWSADN